MGTQRIAVVEDEPDIAEILQYHLKREGYDVAVFDRGDAAYESIQADPPDLVLLDIMLPGIDGLEVARLMQRDARTSRTPLLFLTAKSEEVDRIVGLELGADDYVTKPFSPREIVLRVRAILRRGTESEADGNLKIGDLDLDVPGHRLRVAGADVSLTATEFRLLRVLMERTGRVQTRDRLLSDVWGYSDDVDSRTVDTHIRRLRRKLGTEADRVETVIGVGYRLKS